MPDRVLISRFFSTLPRNVFRAFSGRNLKWHLAAMAATAVIVTSGLDWRYLEAASPLAEYAWYAAILGFLVPFVFPVISCVAGAILNSRRAVLAAYATAQAALMGLIISTFYKVFTGRPGPMDIHFYKLLTSRPGPVRSHFFKLFAGRPAQPLPPIEASREFRFGFLRGGVFWGWPSSHTMVAFAMALAVWRLVDSKAVRIIALLYAFYIGVGVSMTIHWFSDFAAGAIIGTVIGKIAGDTFKDA